MKKKYLKTILISVSCILAVALNIFVSTVIRDYLEVPLYIDTVFTAVIAFSFGLIPGIAVAFFTWLVLCLYYGFNYFVIVSVAEAILIYFLKPASPERGSINTREKVIVSYIGIAAKLMLLYVLCAITVSVLGGVINFISQVLLEIPLNYYSVEDSFKLGLIKNNLSSLAVNILSRIPVNVVDRFIVVFGGYLLSLAVKKNQDCKMKNY